MASDPRALFLRDKRVAREISEDIRRLARELGEEVKIMTFCGTHEHTVTYYGIRSLLPENVRIVAGPGCPVCVTPARDVDVAIELALSGIRVFTYGDMYRVPGSRKSLAEARAEGADVRVVYGIADAIRIAREDGKESAFFSIGFETTAPIPASYLRRGLVPSNLKILSSHRLTVPILRYILESPDIPLRGVIAPGHVSTIVGASAWRFVAEEFGIPVVVAGFEPIDVLLAIDLVLRQLVRGEARLVNEYKRAVKWEGNPLARELMYSVFEAVDGLWRGIGVVPESALELRDSYSDLDARAQYGIEIRDSIDVRPGCRCSDVILGKAAPTECPMFMRACTPSNPKGPCMVSSEGTCSIWAKYGGYPIFRRPPS